MNAQVDQKKPPILLVDDEPEVLFSLKGLLRREFTLYTAQTGQEALEILRNHTVHVVMTDQRMPEMDGAELLARAKNHSPEAIQIVFTGYADIKAVVDAVNSGRLFRYITKPWDPDELVGALHEAAQEYARHEQHQTLLREADEFLHEIFDREAMSGDGKLSHEAVERGRALRAKIQQQLQRQVAT